MQHTPNLVIQYPDGATCELCNCGALRSTDAKGAWHDNKQEMDAEGWHLCHWCRHPYRHCGSEERKRIVL
jgi:hypothetical protein